jgi:multiple RNA-binding domain-containing protein 1
MTERQGSKIVARSTKLIVRNVAFEATEKELKELFSAFGQIKTIRMPRKKFASTHRG